jgi:hypothetical protein
MTMYYLSNMLIYIGYHIIIIRILDASTRHYICMHCSLIFPRVSDMLDLGVLYSAGLYHGSITLQGGAAMRVFRQTF